MSVVHCGMPEFVYIADGMSLCHLDMNECDNSPCRSNQECFNFVGSFSCGCDDGYVMIDRDCIGTYKNRSYKTHTPNMRLLP